MTDKMNTLSPSLWAHGPKRVVDAIVALVLLVVLSPFLLLTALVVKLSDFGPVFFVQARAGKNSQVFVLLKFRTMRAERIPDPKELVPLDHSDVTRLGRVLRRLKIDELPQLWNIFRGEMSLVGPRPTLPDQADAYDDFRRQRLLVRPGLTGLAQVNGNTSVPWDERILYDIAYVRRSSFTLDAAILLRTAIVLVLGEQRSTRPFNETPYAKHVTPPAEYPALRS
jgi:lipopolysaccharide/colanic/teichoic acid biosynthesis glycosyltransferase